MSPLLCALAMEQLACASWQALRPWGITVEETNHVASLYTYDTLVYLQQPEYAVPILLNAMTEFGGPVGLHVNYRKSSLFLLGVLTVVSAALLLKVGLKGKTECKILSIRIAHGD
ncbi:hypothetical protein NDU88_004446 [Pleurodeles waltl]|uniref:Reverse transcriptase domain-containing protein n=1 Tax=Pleurodeles waltl TaxID=8319 RepID=A0AAV7UF34_PLEWA|nr:hypothetical protein NDU88_004446 [Pleurodeles waltl]